MELIFYTWEDREFNVRRAGAQRSWMNNTPEKFAHRCLPLKLANSCGWEILNNRKFSAVWDGGSRPESVQVYSDQGVDATGHFGCGILTFSVNCLIKTPDNINLWIGGSANESKDGISPMNAIVETDWSPYSFTMNWQFTRPNHEIIFEKDEPFCHIFPLSVGLVEQVSPKIISIDKAKTLSDQHEDWCNARRKSNYELSNFGKSKMGDEWQQFYHLGIFPDGKKTPRKHRTKIKVKPFIVDPSANEK